MIVWASRPLPSAIGEVGLKVATGLRDLGRPDGESVSVAWRVRWGGEGGGHKMGSERFGREESVRTAARVGV